MNQIVHKSNDRWEHDMGGHAGVKSPVAPYRPAQPYWQPVEIIYSNLSTGVHGNCYPSSIRATRMDPANLLLAHSYA